MKRQTILKVVAVVTIGVTMVCLQKDLRRRTGPAWQQESMTFLPSGERIKPFLLGFETTVAHYLWIRTILYFGGHNLTDRHYPWLIGMLDIITRLCPRFYPAYEFAGVLLPDVTGDPEASRILLERGLTHIGSTKWNIAFHMGVLHLKYYHDRKTAALYIVRAAMAAGAPRGKLINMASTFYTQAGSAYEGLRVLMFAYETSDNPEVRRHLAEKIAALQRIGDAR